MRSYIQPHPKNKRLRKKKKKAQAKSMNNQKASSSWPIGATQLKVFFLQKDKNGHQHSGDLGLRSSSESSPGTVRNFRATDSYHDSPPRKPAIFLNDRFMAASHEEGCYAKISVTYFLVCKGLSNNGFGVARGGTGISEDRPGRWF